jgi:DNA-binding CsgD family transcriptional regulator
MTKAVAIVDYMGRVRWANKAAAAILQRRDGLALTVDRRLHISAGAARLVFREALHQCAGGIPDTGDGVSPPAIVAPRAAGFPFVLTLLPLPDELSASLGVLALLFISDPDARLPDHFQVLRDACGLSPVEARLVQALAEGQSLKEFALNWQISYETVRSHIRRILHKTGARRQADLVRLVHRLH